MNVNMLKGKIVEKGLNVDAVAGMIDVDRSTLYRKINGVGDKLTIGEANLIVKGLHLTKEEAMSIFFSQCVAYGTTQH